MIVFQCADGRKNKNINKTNLTALSDSVIYYKNRLGSQTASIQTLQLEQQEFKDALLKKDKKLTALAKEFKQVNSVIKYKTVLRADTIFIPFSKTLNSLPHFERIGQKSSPWYSLNYKVNNDSLVLYSFKTWTETSIITGIKQNWLLGKQVVTTDITNSNPYITTSNITSSQIIIIQPWYKKWYVWLAAGLTGGLLLK